jgi:hypothetical protein
MEDDKLMLFKVPSDWHIHTRYKILRNCDNCEHSLWNFVTEHCENKCIHPLASLFCESMFCPFFQELIIDFSKFKFYYEI